MDYKPSSAERTDISAGPLSQETRPTEFVLRTENWDFFSQSLAARIVAELRGHPRLLPPRLPSAVKNSTNQAPGDAPNCTTAVDFQPSPNNRQRLFALWTRAGVSAISSTSSRSRSRNSSGRGSATTSWGRSSLRAELSRAITCNSHTQLASVQRIPQRRFCSGAFKASAHRTE